MAAKKDRLITVTEAAGRLGMSARRVRELCLSGEIISVEVNERLRLIDPQHLKGIVRQRKPKLPREAT